MLFQQQGLSLLQAKNKVEACMIECRDKTLVKRSKIGVIDESMDKTLKKNIKAQLVRTTKKHLQIDCPNVAMAMLPGFEW